MADVAIPRRDRSNIGNAKLLGLMKDIGLAQNPAAYNTSLALYFLGYVLFEIPANMVLKKFNPKIWLPTLTVAWGITATLQALIKNEPGFYAARFFLGVSEAGLFPVSPPPRNFRALRAAVGGQLAHSKSCHLAGNHLRLQPVLQAE